MNREPRRQRTYFILLLVTAFALLTIDYHSDGTKSPLHPFEKAVAGLVGPGEKAVASLVKPLTDQVQWLATIDQSLTTENVRLTNTPNASPTLFTGSTSSTTATTTSRILRSV